MQASSIHTEIDATTKIILALREDLAKLEKEYNRYDMNRTLEDMVAERKQLHLKECELNYYTKQRQELYKNLRNA